MLEKQSKKAQGWWRGDPMSPGGVKFKTEFQGIPIHVDRPKGFVMKGTDESGKEWKRRYKYDYGFIPKTKGGDGEGLDVFLGPKKKATESYWAIQKKPDGTFDEYKIFLGFDNRDQAMAVYRDHIPKKLLGGMVTLRIDMMKSMLGINGSGYGSSGVKTAQFVGFLDEFEKISELVDKRGIEDAKARAKKGIGTVSNVVRNTLSRESFKDRVVGAAKEIKKDVQDRLR